MERIEKIKTHFEEEAQEFDGIILKLIPFYEQMIQALTLSIPFENDQAISVIDLGCGTGTIACKIKQKYPNAQITCLDIAENMIKMAQIKLGDSKSVDYQTGDFYSFNFHRKYDVIVSSLALHHLANDEDKEMFYQKIYDALNHEGVFYNADVVLGSGTHLQELYMKKWKEYMGKSISLEEIENRWIPKYNDEDRPTSMVTHLKMLKKTGFRNIDVVWKYYNFAVYGGSK